jgi:hypothetical protein
MPPEISSMLAGQTDNSLRNLVMAHHEIFGDWPSFSLTADIIKSGDVKFDSYKDALMMFQAVKSSRAAGGSEWMLNAGQEAPGKTPVAEGIMKRSSGYMGFGAESDILDPEMIASFKPKSAEDFIFGPSMKGDQPGEVVRPNEIRLDAMLVELPKQWWKTNIGNMKNSLRMHGVNNAEFDQDKSLMIELNKYLAERMPDEYKPDPTARWQAKTETALSMLQMYRASSIFMAHGGHGPEAEEAYSYLVANGFRDVTSTIDEQIRVPADPTGEADANKRQMITDWYVLSRSPSQSERQAIHELYDLNPDAVTMEAQALVGADHMSSLGGFIVGAANHVGAAIDDIPVVSNIIESDEFGEMFKTLSPIAGEINEHFLSKGVEALGYVASPLIKAWEVWDKYSTAAIMATAEAEGVIPGLIKSGLLVGGAAITIGTAGAGWEIGVPMMIYGAQATNKEDWMRGGPVADFLVNLYHASDGDIEWFGDWWQQFQKAEKGYEESPGAYWGSEIMRDLGLHPEAHPEVAFMFTFGAASLRDFAVWKGGKFGLGYASDLGYVPAVIEGGVEVEPEVLSYYNRARQLGSTDFVRWSMGGALYSMIKRNPGTAVERWSSTYNVWGEDVEKIVSRVLPYIEDKTVAMKKINEEINRLGLGVEKVAGKKVFKAGGETSRWKGAQRLDPYSWNIGKMIREKMTYGSFADKHPVATVLFDREMRDPNVPLTRDKLDVQSHAISWQMRRIVKPLLREPMRRWQKETDELAEAAKKAGMPVTSVARKRSPIEETAILFARWMQNKGFKVTKHDITDHAETLDDVGDVMAGLVYRARDIIGKEEGSVHLILDAQARELREIQFRDAVLRFIDVYTTRVMQKTPASKRFTRHALKMSKVSPNGRFSEERIGQWRKIGQDAGLKEGELPLLFERESWLYAQATRAKRAEYLKDPTLAEVHEALESEGGARIKTFIPAQGTGAKIGGKQYERGDELSLALDWDVAEELNDAYRQEVAHARRLLDELGWTEDEVGIWHKPLSEQEARVKEGVSKLESQIEAGEALAAEKAKQIKIVSASKKKKLGRRKKTAQEVVDLTSEQYGEAVNAVVRGFKDSLSTQLRLRQKEIERITMVEKLQERERAIEAAHDAAALIAKENADLRISSAQNFAAESVAKLRVVLHLFRATGAVEIDDLNKLSPEQVIDEVQKLIPYAEGEMRRYADIMGLDFYEALARVLSTSPEYRHLLENLTVEDFERIVAYSFSPDFTARGGQRPDLIALLADDTGLKQSVFGSIESIPKYDRYIDPGRPKTPNEKMVAYLRERIDEPRNVTPVKVTTKDGKVTYLDVSGELEDPVQLSFDELIEEQLDAEQVRDLFRRWMVRYIEHNLANYRRASTVLDEDLAEAEARQALRDRGFALSLGEEEAVSTLHVDRVDIHVVSDTGTPRYIPPGSERLEIGDLGEDERETAAALTEMIRQAIKADDPGNKLKLRLPALDPVPLTEADAADLAYAFGTALINTPSLRLDINDMAKQVYIKARNDKTATIVFRRPRELMPAVDPESGRRLPTLFDLVLEQVNKRIAAIEETSGGLSRAEAPLRRPTAPEIPRVIEEVEARPPVAAQQTVADLDLGINSRVALFYDEKSKQYLVHTIKDDTGHDHNEAFNKIEGLYDVVDQEDRSGIAMIFLENRKKTLYVRGNKLSDKTRDTVARDLVASGKIGEDWTVVFEDTARVWRVGMPAVDSKPVAEITGTGRVKKVARFTDVVGARQAPVQIKKIHGKSGGIDLGRSGPYGRRRGNTLANREHVLPSDKGDTTRAVEAYKKQLDDGLRAGPGTPIYDDFVELAERVRSGEVTELRCPTTKPHSPCHVDHLIRRINEWIERKPAPETPAVDNRAYYAMHSGGANGADTVWGDAFEQATGVAPSHYYVEGVKTPRGNAMLTQAQVAEAEPHVRAAAGFLGKRAPSKPQPKALIYRNWFQVKNSKGVYAVVSGHPAEASKRSGTGWAIAMAIETKKPVFVFDQVSGKWYTWQRGVWATTKRPTLTNNFAGIGTRKITAAGRAEIKATIDESFGAAAKKPTEPIEQAVASVGDLKIELSFINKRLHEIAKRDEHGFIVRRESRVSEKVGPQKTYTNPAGKRVTISEPQLKPEGTELDELLARKKYLERLIREQEAPPPRTPFWDLSPEVESGVEGSMTFRQAVKETAETLKISEQDASARLARFAEDAGYNPYDQLTFTKVVPNEAMLAAEKEIAGLTDEIDDLGRQITKMQGQLRAQTKTLESNKLRLTMALQRAREGTITIPDEEYESIRKLMERVIDGFDPTVPNEMLGDSLDDRLYTLDSMLKLLQSQPENTIKANMALTKGLDVTDPQTFAVPGMSWQLMQWHKMRYNPHKTAKFLGGRTLRTSEMISAYKFGGVVSADDATNFYKSLIMLRVSTMLRIPLADEATRLAMLGINPLRAWKKAKELIRLDKYPKDQMSAISTLFKMAVDDEIVIAFGEKGFRTAYYNYATNSRRSQEYLWWYFGRLLGPQRQESAVKSWLASTDVAGNEKLAEIMQQLVAEQDWNKAWLALGAAQNGPLRGTALHTFRVSKLDVQATKELAEGERSWVDALDHMFTYFHDHPVFGKHWQLDDARVPHDVKKVVVDTVGDPSLKSFRKFQEAMTHGGPENLGVGFGEIRVTGIHDDDIRALRKAISEASTETERLSLQPVIAGRRAPTIDANLPVIGRLQHAVFHILDVVGKKLNEAVYTSSFEAELANLRKLRTTNAEYSLMSDLELETRAHFQARKFTEEMMFNGSVYFGEDILRNIFMFLPAYRQFAEFWLPRIIKNPMLGSLVYRANRDKENLEYQQIPGTDLQINIGQVSFLINQGDGAVSGWLPSGGPLLTMPISYMATKYAGQDSIWGELPTHWPFEFATPFRALNSPLDKMFYGVTGRRLPWPLGTDPTKDPWRELQAVRKDALEGKWPKDEKSYNYANRLKALVEGGWNFLVPWSMRISDPDVEKMVMARKEYSSAQTPAQVAEILNRPENKVFKEFVTWQNTPSWEQLDYLKTHPKIIPFMVSGYENPNIGQQGRVGWLWSEMRKIGIANPDYYVNRLDERFDNFYRVIGAEDARKERDAEVKWWESYKRRHSEDHDIERLDNEWQTSTGAFGPQGSFYQQGKYGYVHYQELIDLKYGGISDTFTGISSYDTDAYRLAEFMDNAGGASRVLLQSSPNYEMYLYQKINKQKDAVKEIADSFLATREPTQLNPEQIKAAGYSQREAKQLAKAINFIDKLWDETDRRIRKYGKYGYATSAGRELRKRAIKTQNSLIRSSPITRRFLGDGPVSMLRSTYLTKPAWQRDDYINLDEMDPVERDTFYRLVEKKRYKGPYLPEESARVLPQGTVKGWVPVMQGGKISGWKVKVKMGPIVGVMSSDKTPREATQIQLTLDEGIKLMQSSFERAGTTVAQNRAWRAKVKKLPEWAQGLVFDSVRAEGWRFWLDFAAGQRRRIRDTINTYYSDTPGFSLQSKYGMQLKNELLRYGGYCARVSPEFGAEWRKYNGDNELVNSMLSWYL